MGNKKRNNNSASRKHNNSKNSNQKERYTRKMLSSEGEGNTNDFPYDLREGNYGETTEALGRGISSGFEDRHRIIPPKNDTQQDSKSISSGSIIAWAGIIVTIVLAIIAGVYKFGNLEGRFQENINKLDNTNKSLSELIDKIATISERVAKIEERGQYSQETFESIKNMKKQLEDFEKDLLLVKKQTTEFELSMQSVNSLITKIESEISQNQGVKPDK